MLGSIKEAGAADWSVLVLDPVSTRVMSHACQISEILDYGISCKSCSMHNKLRSWLAARWLHSYRSGTQARPHQVCVTAVVENIEKKREPLLSVSGVYFITPTDRSVQLLLNDWKLKPQYKTAHVFFTSKVTPGQLQAIKTCPGLAQRLRSLKEVRVQLL